MDSAHRKIELQSPADLAYLESNVRLAARQKIDRDLPASAAPEGEDRLRRRVEELVDEYIRTTFAAAGQNFTINGLDAGTAEHLQQPMKEDFEPFDTRLADRIRALEAQKETLTETVADLRRTAPSKTAGAFEDAWGPHDNAENNVGAGIGANATEDQSGPVDLGQLERWEDVQKTWGRGADGLVGLKKSLGDTLARLQRAEGVVGEVAGRS